ncbi:thiamine phosphate synthase [Pontibaca sp. S1109L]|uniref:Thiamine phosphate synthase n=2 Tax=Pontibaca salina TaxID=2795731 RepID=A0A934M0R4_9RHOB|nr:thiamine phosphate synthase [Pontibaca salina]
MLDPFYLVVDHVGRLELLVPHGVKLVQLRITDQPESEIRRQIARARDICAVHRAQLVVHEHWEIALDLNCSFVNLQQKDVPTTDFAALRRAGMRFGLSASNEAELAQALRHNPAYVALGPVYSMHLTGIGSGPQGLGRVRRWKTAASNVPLVAFGGVTPERLPGLFAAGVNSAAIGTDIQQAEDPEARCAEWIAATRDYG